MLKTLARMLGLTSVDQAADSMKSEAAARAVLSRRGLFQVAGAGVVSAVMAEHGAIWSLPGVQVADPWEDDPWDYRNTYIFSTVAMVNK